MSVAGCFADFRVGYGGAASWAHVLAGRRVVLTAPPSAGNNIEAHVAWVAAGRGAFLADQLAHVQRYELQAGERSTLARGLSRRGLRVRAVF